MARGGARPGAGRKAGKSANTSPLSRRARARARIEAGNQRPWPADKVERWSIDRLIPYAKNARTHTDAQVAAIAASIKEWGWTTPALVGEDGMVEGGTPWGLPRLQPERQGPDRGLGLVGAAHARRARVDASRVGRGGRLRSCGIHAGHRR